MEMNHEIKNITNILISFMKFYQNILHDYNPSINYWAIADTMNFEKHSDENPILAFMIYEIIKSYHEKILKDMRFDLNIFCLYHMCDIILSHPESDDGIKISEYFISEEDEQLFDLKCSKCHYTIIHKNCKFDRESHYSQLTSDGRFLLADIIGRDIIKKYINKY